MADTTMSRFMKPRKVRAKATPVKPARSKEPDEEPAEDPSARQDYLIRWNNLVEKSKKQFQYDKIDGETEARLLLLYPGKRDTPIQVTLQKVGMDELGDTYHYDALSYYWGEGPQSKIVFIRPLKGKHETEKIKTFDDAYRLSTLQLKVKQNLYAALQHLREENDEVILWIVKYSIKTKRVYANLCANAICIHQENQHEKERQVARMAHIYSRADQVCIWLGHGDESCADAMDFVPQILGSQNLDKFVGDQKHVDRWLNLAKLMCRDWFTRRWVIQELALAKQAVVQFGHKQISWDDLRDAISLFHLHYDTIGKNFSGADQSDRFKEIGELDLLGAKVLVDVISNIFRKKADGTIYEPTAGLETLVSSLSTFNSSDPRDTINALRNIAKETSEIVQGEFVTVQPSSNSKYPPPTPDYTKSVLVVYKEFVKWVINSTGSLDIICRHWALSERIATTELDPRQTAMSTKLPSWVKKISDSKYGAMLDGRTGRKSADDFVNLPGRSPYAASYNLEAEVYFSVPEYQEMLQKPPSLPKPLQDSMEKDSAPNTRPSRRPTFPGGVIDPMQTNGDLPNISRNLSSPSTPTAQSPRIASVANGFQRTVDNLDLSRSEQASDDGTWTNSEQAEPGAQEPNSNGVRPRTFKVTEEFETTVKERSPERSLRRSTTLKAAEASDRSLYVKGIQIGTVGTASDAIADGVIPRDAIRRGGYNNDGAQARERAPDKLWRTLVADRGPDGGPTPPWYHRACLECLTNDTVNGHINVKDLLASKKKLQHVRRYLERVRSVVWERIIFEGSPIAGSGDKPMYGLGPQSTLSEDIICILFGCSVPVILRKKSDEDDDEYFEFIGEAFVYGSMDGECVTMMSEDELQKRARFFKLM